MPKRCAALTAAFIMLSAGGAFAAQAPLWTADVKRVEAAPALMRDGARSLAVVIGEDGLVALDARGREVWRNPIIKGDPYALATAPGPPPARVFPPPGRVPSVRPGRPLSSGLPRMVTALGAPLGPAPPAGGLAAGPADRGAVRASGAAASPDPAGRLLPVAAGRLVTSFLPSSFLNRGKSSLARGASSK